MSAAQKKHYEAGERLCRRCAEEREKSTLASNNRKRKAAAEAEALQCCVPGCGVTFRETDHLTQSQVLHYREKAGRRVVCGACHKRGATAKSVVDATKRLERELTCAACNKGFPRQGHISSAQETEHFRKGRKVVCAACMGAGLTSRSWQAYECAGACRRKLPKSEFVVGPHFARSQTRGTLKCKSCAGVR